jgi:uncharacterized protein YdhG (YjbR/CyaY superfamily)
MAELKTKPTDASVDAYLSAIPDEQRQEECQVIAEMMQRATKAKAQMWGSMIGFGSYHYKYPSGREGDWFLTGFAPRKKALTLYIMAGFAQYDALLEKLGKYRTGKSCLYIKRLADVDLKVLEKLILLSVNQVAQEHAGVSGAA